MDWSKAKTVLIVGFFLLNIFMLVMLVFTRSNNPLTDDYIKYSKDYLASKNIEVKASIPRVSRNTGKVLYSTKKYNIDVLCKLVFGTEFIFSENEDVIDIVDGEEIITLSEEELYIKDKIPEKDLWLGDMKAFEDRLIKYLKKIGFKKSDLLFTKTSETEQEKEIIFNIKYKNLLVYDQSITARLNKEGILTISAPTKVIKSENGTGDILSAYQILVMGDIPSNIVVEKIDIGYRRISKGDLYGVPMWRIELDDGTTMFYNSLTGEKLSW